MRLAIRVLAVTLGLLCGAVVEAQTTPLPPSLFGIAGGGAVELGQRVVLQVQFSGTGAGQTYQWRKSGVNLPGATAASYTIEAATAADSGTYAAAVSNAAGASVATTDVSVKAAAAPVITSPPRTTVAQVGQTITFSFAATGSYPRTHQWRKDGGDLPGATAATLVLENITTTQAGVYSVQVANAIGATVSAAASLTVNAATPPIISSFSPSDGTYTQGQQAMLSVSLSGGSSPFSFQWVKNGAPLAGATGSQLAFAAVGLADAGRYAVTVTNVAGSATSREANLVVNAATPASITSAPRAVTVFQGQSASFSVGAGGSSPLTYQWLKNGGPIAGATGSSYSIPATTLADAGNYAVVVANIAGTATSAAATLIVNPPVVPRITTEPRDVTIAEGESTSFGVVADGSPPLSYQWYFNGVRLTASATSSTLSLAPKLIDAGDYQVVVTNPAGSVSSRPARLTVTPLPPPPVVRLYNQTATIGSSFSYSASYYSSSGSPTYQWYKDGVAIPQATSSSYGVGTAKVEDGGDYFVVVTNSGGATTSRTGRVIVAQPTTPPAGAWLAAERSGNILYFVFANPARIERFSLATETWLAPLSLPRAPAAFAVGPEGFYVASGSVIYRYTLEGTGEAVLSSAFNSSVGGLVLSGGYLLAQHGGYSSGSLSSVRLSDGAIISTRNYVYYWGPSMAIAPTAGRIFSRTIGISPSDITTTTIQPNGTLGTSATDSPYHGDYPDATRVFVSPNEAYVADNGGTVYRTTDLRFVGGLGGRLDDLGFTAANLPVILRGGQIILFNALFTESGRIASGLTSAVRVFVEGGHALVFGYPPGGGTIPWAKVALAQVDRPPTAAPVDASTLGFTPDSVFLDRTGVLHLYSKIHRQLFRWSPAERRYLAPIPLQGWPDYVAYSATSHRAYLGYVDSRVLQVRLDAGSALEEPFVTVPQQVLGLTTAGEYVFAVDPSGAWCSYFTYAPDGRLVAQRDWSYVGAEYAWNPVLRRMYQFRDDTSPNDLLYTEILANGTFGPQKDSPYHGEIETRYPIRISPDGGSVLLGSGKFYDASTMVPNNSLANRIDDAAWIGGRLFTGRAAGSGAEFQRWGGNNYALDATRTLGGRLIRLLALPDGRLLAVTVRDGGCVFTILDTGLNELSSDAAGPPNRLANLAARAMVGRGDQMLIPGFVVSGSQPKRVLVRAAGPALAAFGVTGLLADPRLVVFNAAGVAVASNDDWGGAANLGELLTVTARVGAFALSTGSRDAAALISLEPGAYTVQASGANDTTGVALVEVYDAQDAGSSSRLVNIAARAQVGAGADVLIPGIVLQGSVPKTVLVRAIGPGLAAFGVTGRLGNPRLRVYRGNQMVEENDDWDQPGGAAAGQVAAAAGRVGAFALATGSRDAALLLTLQPGSYTAHVSGADGGTGVALVEVYEVP